MSIEALPIDAYRVYGIFSSSIADKRLLFCLMIPNNCCMIPNDLMYETILPLNLTQHLLNTVKNVCLTSTLVAFQRGERDLVVKFKK